MSIVGVSRDEDSVEQCLDELGEALRALQHYSPTVLAVAVRVHLEALLQVLLESRLCTPAEVRAYFRELEGEVLQYEN